MQRFVLVLVVASQVLSAQSSTTVALQSSPNPATLGAPVTLSAMVTPASASGPVTFYDGVAILGVSQLSNGQATFTTRLLNTGAHTLRAYYGGQWSSASQTVNAVAAKGFQPAVINSAGASPGAIVAADFKGDGKTDLAVVNSTGGISILSGNGDGTFQPGVSYAMSWTATGIAVGDFNNDGKPDLAVSSSGQVGIMLGNGDGSFQAPTPFAVGNGASSIVVIDANRDGNADLAVLNQGDATVSVLLGNGDGTFQQAVGYPVAGLGTQHQMMVAGDFNADGIPDLAITFGMYVAVLLGNGDGTFQALAKCPPPTESPLISTATSIAAGDFDGDGKVDLAVGNDMTGVNVLLGNGDGTFQVLKGSDQDIAQLIPYFAGQLVVADFNGDGKLDLAVGDYGHTDTDGVTIAFGNGDGTFQAPSFYHVGPNPTSGLVAGNFTADGRTDLAATMPLGNSVGILLAQSGANPVVSVVSVNPSFGSGATQTFSFEFSDSAGADDIATVVGWIGTGTLPSPGPTCAVTYSHQQNTLALWNDDGSVPIGLPLGTGSQQNSFCSLNGSASSVTLSGNSLTLNLALTFFFVGPSEISAGVASVTGSASGWQLVGNWQAGIAPQAVSVTPSSGTGMSGTFTFVYNSAYGASNLFEVSATFQTQQSSCDVSVYMYSSIPGLQGVYVGDNNGSLGASGTLQSPQCSLNLGTSSGVSSGNTYTLTLSLTFTSALAGVNSIVGGASLGMFQLRSTETLGMWTVAPACNITSDATASIADVQRIVNEALGAWSPTDDMNFDGAVNVIDVQIVVNAALNIGCY